jgi:hyperosmotically inducible periplasmic protein
MSRRHVIRFVLICTLTLAGGGSVLRDTPLAAAAQTRVAGGKQIPVYLVREVRHQLLMLPYYTVFDWIQFRVQGYAVALTGEVVNPSLKSDAGNVVKGIEGVEKVTNNIKVLPPSPGDARIRLGEYRAIYGFPSFEKYAIQVVGPIHIIVDMGQVTLEGVVDSQSDKNIAGIRANGVPGTFSVTNNLMVVSNSK